MGDEDSDKERGAAMQTDKLHDIVKNAVKQSSDDFIDSVEKLVDTRISQNKDSFDFKHKGNAKQFELNADIQKHLKGAWKSLDHVVPSADSRGSLKRAFEELDEALDKLSRRNKHIKLADMSEAGWRVVDEYASHELASNSEDEKKIFRAETRAKRKMREASFRSRRRRPYGFNFQQRTESSAIPRGGLQEPQQKFSFGPGRRPGVCYQCGKPGHWRAECFSYQRSSNATSSMVSSREQDDKISKSNSCTHSVANSNVAVNNCTDKNACKSSEKTKDVSSIRQVGCLAGNLNVLSPVGRLKCSLNKWRSSNASSFVVDLIENGYKIPLKSVPVSISLRNNASARKAPVFVGGAINDLLAKGCITRTDKIPHVVNPLTVAYGKSGKQRLVLDCRHVNPCLNQVKFRYEDVSVASKLVNEGDVGFNFDLKSAYHHIPITENHKTFLGFSWDSKFYVFNVLPFGLSTAGYIFTKVLRHLVKVWRSKGLRVVLYLDDGFVVTESGVSAEETV